MNLYDNENGHIKIYFGTVTSVADQDHDLRAQVMIKGKTDQLDEDQLPWYYPFTGVNFIPEENDIVAVLIFDDVITSGFYMKKLNYYIPDMEDNDYKNYVELFKKTVDNDNVEMTYKPSEGVIIQNSDGIININKDSTNIGCGNNNMKVSNSEIILGDENKAQYALKGDAVIKTISDLTDVVDSILNTFGSLSAQIMIPSLAACSTPFTLAFSAPIAALMLQMTQLHALTATIKTNINSSFLQSSKTKIE